MKNGSLVVCVKTAPGSYVVNGKVVKLLPDIQPDNDIIYTVVDVCEVRGFKDGITYVGMIPVIQLAEDGNALHPVLLQPLTRDIDCFKEVQSPEEGVNILSEVNETVVI